MWKGDVRSFTFKAHAQISHRSLQCLQSAWYKTVVSHGILLILWNLIHGFYITGISNNPNNLDLRVYFLNLDSYGPSKPKWENSVTWGDRKEVLWFPGKTNSESPKEIVTPLTCPHQFFYVPEIFILERHRRRHVSYFQWIYFGITADVTSL